MEQDVMFSEALPVSDPAPPTETGMAALPYNYLPAALTAIAGDDLATNRIVLTPPVPDAGLPGLYAVIGKDRLASPEQTVQFVGELQAAAGPLREGRPWLLGPPSLLAETQGAELSALPQVAWEPIGLDRIDAAVVIIDSGIAFWNPRFRTASGARFRSIRFLDFDQPQAGMRPGDVLAEADIRSYCDMADTAGAREVIAALRARHPGSFYGSAAAEDLDGLWHGTAIADLAGGIEGVPPKSVALFGIELPTAAVQDYSGDSLTHVLSAALDVAVTMTAAIATKPVIVVLPYGFSGGPQDGEHPAAQIIAQTLAAQTGRDLRVVVSAGNHLQDRYRAHLPPALPNVAPLALDWWAPPDDFSVNVLEVIIDNVAPADPRIGLQLTAPTNETAAATGMRVWEYRLITRRGAVIGAMLRFPNSGLRARLRMALMPTGHRTTATTAPHGRWLLSSQSDQPADLWLLRDDRDQLFDQAFPHRASRFDHPMYRPRNKLGAPNLLDDPGSPVMRSGTLSVLATATAARAVQADEKLGTDPQGQAEYSGRRNDGAPLGLHYLVDAGWPMRGAAASANGTLRRVRVSGSSAAAAMDARKEIGFPAPPAL